MNPNQSKEIVQVHNIYACVVARSFSVQSLLRLRPDLQDKPIAVLDGEPPNQLVCSVSDRALAMGVAPGMTKVEMDLFPSILTLPRSLQQEATARAALLECAGGFSPLVEDRSIGDCFICVTDITGTETLFGRPDILAPNLRRHAGALRMQTSVAVTGNCLASECLALGNPGAVCVVNPGMERSALATLPLSVLPLSPEHAETFSLWGIRTLGQLANLKVNELITRLGQPGKTLWLLARGEAPHLFRAIEAGLVLEERMELDSPVELLDSLLFVAGVMLDQLILRVQSRILALASVTLQLGLENGTVHTRTIRAALPTNDRQLWLKLAHLDMLSNPPTAGIRSLILNAQPGSTSKVQLGLFSPQVPEPMRLDVTLARIRSIVGEGCVGSAELKDTHGPDSFSMRDFHVPAAEPGASARTSAAGVQAMAIRTIRPAESVTVTLQSGQPASLTFREKQYVVERVYGPWSSAGDWWKPTLWSTEQWDLVAKEQYRTGWLCCCLTHDLARDRWLLEALYD